MKDSKSRITVYAVRPNFFWGLFLVTFALLVVSIAIGSLTSSSDYHSSIQDRMTSRPSVVSYHESETMVEDLLLIDMAKSDLIKLLGAPKYESDSIVMFELDERRGVPGFSRQLELHVYIKQGTVVGTYILNAS